MYTRTDSYVMSHIRTRKKIQRDFTQKKSLQNRTKGRRSSNKGVYNNEKNKKNHCSQMKKKMQKRYMR